MTSHPREGWSQERGHRSPGFSRRDFLRAGSGLALGSLGALGLDALAAGDAGANSRDPLPRPDHPVTWPIYKSNKPIRSGLQPEKNATLQLYNWVAYINPQVVKNFEKKYKCKVQITTFQTMTEAIAKLRTGELQFDVFIPTVDQLGSLIQSQLLQPLNHSYIPNITQAWPQYQNPFYDEKWQYTTPYTIWTTGVAWRKDKVPENPYKMANGYAMLWNSKYKGKVAILDDYRESISLGLMKSGYYDLNTSSTRQLNTSQANLDRLDKLTNVQIDNNDYSNVPSGKIWIHHAWSGDMAAAPQYMPKGTPVSVIGYWFPSDGKGPVGNDTVTVLKGSKNPVLAHLFLNYMLDLSNVLENISYNGYMQPLNEVTPAKLVAEKLLPPSLISTAVLPSYFQTGVRELELAPANNARWLSIWNRFSGGL